MNAGKPEQEYRSHYTKNDKGIVLCPTILNATCTYCKTQGHFKKECPSLKAKEQLKTLKIIVPRNDYEDEVITTSAPQKKPEKSYMAAIKQQAMNELFDDDDDDEEVENAPIRAPTPFIARKRRDIMHDWADDEYWSDSNEDFM